MQERIGEIIYVKFLDGNITKYEITDRSFVYRKEDYLYTLKCVEKNQFETISVYGSALEDNKGTEEEYLALAGQLLTNGIRKHKQFLKQIDNLTHGL